MRRFARHWYGPVVWAVILAWFTETLWGLPAGRSLTYAIVFLGLGLIAVGAEWLRVHLMRRAGRTGDEWMAVVRERRSRIMAMVVTFGSLVVVAAVVALLR